MLLSVSRMYVQMFRHAYPITGDITTYYNIDERENRGFSKKIPAIYHHEL